MLQTHVNNDIYNKYCLLHNNVACKIALHELKHDINITNIVFYITCAYGVFMELELILTDLQPNELSHFRQLFA